MKLRLFHLHNVISERSEFLFALFFLLCILPAIECVTISRESILSTSTLIKECSKYTFLQRNPSLFAVCYD